MAWVHVVCEKNRTCTSRRNISFWTPSSPCPLWHNGFAKSFPSICASRPHAGGILCITDVHISQESLLQLGKEKSLHLSLGLTDEDYNVIDGVRFGFCFFVMFKTQQRKKRHFHPSESPCGLVFFFHRKKGFSSGTRKCHRLVLYREKGCFSNIRKLYMLSWVFSEQMVLQLSHNSSLC